MRKDGMIRGMILYGAIIVYLKQIREKYICYTKPLLVFEKCNAKKDECPHISSEIHTQHGT